MIIDFPTLVNPLTLLQSLLVFRPANEELVVGKYNIDKVRIRRQGVQELRIDLLDPKALPIVDDHFGGGQMRFAADNVSLAVRILQFAVRQGYIQVTDQDQTMWGWAAVIEKANTANVDYLALTPWIFHGDTGYAIGPADEAHSFSQDFSVAWGKWRQYCF